ncbi:MAG: phosphoribosylglycinamide formyltransferase [Oxalobacteraceae bacterium]|jgi:phosphoribosylglycinamide formyltransferase-1|nr:phosphoribosylglycinamide formyltransferase [Oxalobacteraceae bacterium]
MRAMKRIVILISGRGSNMAALLQAASAEQWPAQVVAVISNQANAAGLATASAAGIAARVVEHVAYPDRAQFDQALSAVIDAYAPDLVVLAGFLRILTPEFVEHYHGRLLNIHPSLLPSFPGLDTHRRALEAGVKVHGATVHFVTPELDHGPIIEQATVPVLDTDTEDTLASRVLEQEHVIYPRTVREFIEGRYALVAGRVVRHPV